MTRQLYSSGNTLAAELLREWLTTQQWNGQDHLSALTDHFIGQGTPNTSYIRQWIVGAAKRFFTPSSNHILVLAGPQAIGKSEFARWISPRPTYYGWLYGDDDARASRRAMSVSDRNVAASQMIQFAIVECFGVPDIALHTAPYVRTPYMGTETHAIASTIVTTNYAPKASISKPVDKLLIVEMDDYIDWDYTRLDIGQIWAQAVAEAEVSNGH
jgi:predicted P-loop ATPase